MLAIDGMTVRLAKTLERVAPSLLHRENLAQQIISGALACPSNVVLLNGKPLVGLSRRSFVALCSWCGTFPDQGKRSRRLCQTIDHHVVKLQSALRAYQSLLPSSVPNYPKSIDHLARDLESFRRCKPLKQLARET